LTFYDREQEEEDAMETTYPEDYDDEP